MVKRTREHLLDDAQSAHSETPHIEHGNNQSKSLTLHDASGGSQADEDELSSEAESDYNSSEDTSLELDEREDDGAVKNPLILPQMLLAYAEDIISKTERDVELYAGEAWTQAMKALDKAQMLLHHSHPQMPVLLTEAQRMHLEPGGTKVPPGSKDVLRSRADVRYVLCMIHVSRAKLLAAKALDPSTVEVLSELHDALMYFPRSAQALLLFAQAQRALVATEQQLAAVEAILRKAVTASFPPPLSSSSSASQAEADVSPEDIELEKKAQKTAKQLLALLLCQDGRLADACKFLQALGHTWRLAKHVLKYPLPPPVSPGIEGTKVSSADKLAQAFDSALPEPILAHLRHVFRSDGLFWREHNYDLATNSARDVGYFSYQFPLCPGSMPVPGTPVQVPPQAPPRVSIEAIVLELHRLACHAFPQVVRASVAEWWVHTRVHSSGHQLHYDSDETVTEAGGAPRHPLASAVLYLDEDDPDGLPTGGPTLVTNQRLGGGLATEGYLCYPRAGRLCVFDAQYLHGVLPGRGPMPRAGRRRLTFMVSACVVYGSLSFALLPLST